MYNDDYTQTLQQKLKRRIERLKSASSSTYYYYLCQFDNLIEKNFILKCVVKDLILRNKGAKKDAENFIQKHDVKIFPQEDYHAAVCYAIFKKVILSKDRDLPIYCGQRYQTGANAQVAIQLFTYHILDFLCAYIDEKIDQFKITTAFLSKYKYRCEWFNRKQLHTLWERNKKQGENKLKIDMVNYLFDRGEEIEFTEPLSPSGRVDLVLAQGTDKKLIIEGKIFTTSAKIRSDLVQIYVYAKEYNEPFGYLIIFNPTKKEIIFQTSKDSEKIYNLPYIDFKDKRIFLIVINLNPYQKSASKRKELKSIEITEKYLLEPF